MSGFDMSGLGRFGPGTSGSESAPVPGSGTGFVPVISHPPPETPETAGQSRIIPIAELERRAILNAIVESGGDKLLAARLLGIGKTTLYRKLKEYNKQTLAEQT